MDIGLSMRDLEISDIQSGISKVRCLLDDGTYLEAGNDTGATMTCTCGWATQEAVDAILQRVMGYRYQPYTATNAVTDPALELGDAVFVNGTQGDVINRTVTFGKMLLQDLSTNVDEELAHEYVYQPTEFRSYSRRIGTLFAELSVTAEAITATAQRVEGMSSDVATAVLTAQGASLQVSSLDSVVNGDGTAQNPGLVSTVSQQAGLIANKVNSVNGNSNFGWELTDQKFVVKSNGLEVMAVTATGTKFTGTVEATEGFVGGWHIGAGDGALRLDDGEYGGTYLGPGGLIVSTGELPNDQLFVVTPWGHTLGQDVEIVNRPTSPGGYSSTLFGINSAGLTGGIGKANWTYGAVMGLNRCQGIDTAALFVWDDAINAPRYADWINVNGYRVLGYPSGGSV